MAIRDQQHPLMNPQKIITSFLAFTLVFCSITQPLSAANFGKFTYTVDGNSITITDYPPNATGALTIPSTIEGKRVTRIGPSAFKFCGGLTAINLPNDITHIGNHAFELCKGLENFTIPDRVHKIGDSVFAGCYGLKNIAIPNHVTSIGNDAFYFCEHLTKVTIPGNVTQIGNAAFGHCGKLTSITFKGNAPATGSSVFIYASSLLKIHYYKGKLGFTTRNWKRYSMVRINGKP